MTPRVFLVALAIWLTGAGLAAAQGSKSLVGKLLVAEPSMPDPRFRRTVILIVAQKAEGTVGLVVNRALGERPLAAILRGYGLPAAGARGRVTVHYGGPVGFRQMTTLHTPDYRKARTVVFPNRAYAMTADPSLFRDLADGKGPRRYIVLLGRSTWAPGQLEREIRERAWFTIPFDAELVFGRDQGGKWRRALNRRRIDL